MGKRDEMRQLFRLYGKGKVFRRAQAAGEVII